MADALLVIKQAIEIISYIAQQISLVEFGTVLQQIATISEILSGLYILWQILKFKKTSFSNTIYIIMPIDALLKKEVIYQKNSFITTLIIC